MVREVQTNPEQDGQFISLMEEFAAHCNRCANSSWPSEIEISSDPEQLRVDLEYLKLHLKSTIERTQELEVELFEKKYLLRNLLRQKDKMERALTPVTLVDNTYLAKVRAEKVAKEAQERFMRKFGKVKPEDIPKILEELKRKKEMKLSK
ncbi:MAG: hypothetical protein WC479_07310 [Candidatus Izemoplasmatales bacterium]